MKKNPVAKDLRTPKYRQRKVESKKKYNRKEVVGYYYDGKKSWKLYKDEDGNESQEEWNNSESNYDYSGVDHNNSLHNNKKKRRR